MRKGKLCFTLKHDGKGLPVRHKVRYVAKGFSAIYGQDYNKTTSPTMCAESFWTILHVGASRDWSIHQVDVKTAFLHGILSEDKTVYMEQPDGFAEEGYPTDKWVWELQKGLHGMKQARRLWYKTMHRQMLELGFSWHLSDPCIYIWKDKDGTILTRVHVDDYIITGSSDLGISKFKDELHQHWTISDLSEMKFCLGITVTCNKNDKTISLSQTALIDQILDTFSMQDCYPVTTPMDHNQVLSQTSSRPLDNDNRVAFAKLPYQSLVGSLMYLAIGSRPDIALPIQKLSQFLDCYTNVHYNAALCVVRYLKGTRNLSLNLSGSNPTQLLGFSDASYGMCPDTQRSTGSYCFTLGSGIVSWAARKQKTVAQLTMDAKYIALHKCSKEAIWLRALLNRIELAPIHPSPILANNNGANILAEDPTFHNRAKYINIKFHAIREYIDHGHLSITYVPTHDNVADIFTKALPPKPFAHLRELMGVF